MPTRNRKQRPTVAATPKGWPYPQPKKWRAWCTFLRQIWAWLVYTVANAGQKKPLKNHQKPRFLPNFQVWGLQYPRPSLTRAKFSVTKWTHSTLCNAKLYLDQYTMSLQRDKNRQTPRFWQKFVFCSSCTNSIAAGSQIWHERVDQFQTNRFIEERKPNVAVFLNSTFCGLRDKVERGCTTTTLPLSTISKLFLYNNSFMAKS